MKYHPDTRRPPLRREPPPAPVAHIAHYDPRSLARTETPLRPVANQCAYCSAMIEPAASRRNDLGEWACADRPSCWARVQRNEHGGW